jgi:hypothetical protein
MSPEALTNEYTCQFEFGPLQSVQVWPPMLMPVWICEPTGWMPPRPESQIMIS